MIISVWSLKIINTNGQKLKDYKMESVETRHRSQIKRGSGKLQNMGSVSFVKTKGVALERASGTSPQTKSKAHINSSSYLPRQRAADNMPPRNNLVASMTAVGLTPIHFFIITILSSAFAAVVVSMIIYNVGKCMTRFVSTSRHSLIRNK